jgi:tetratricopeptide (TPR) repeat protein
MEQEPIQSTPPNTPKALFGPWPWYILLVTGFALTGFFPWLMVSYAFYQREKKRTAILSFFVNLILFFAFSWVLLKSSVVWWWIVSFSYLFSVAWALTAWIFQRKTLGSAARRYVLSECKTWITPVLIGVIMGMCMATAFAIIPADQNRAKMMGTRDSLERETILWDFFMYIPAGVVIGGFLGFWWAGEREQFRASHVITFLSALTLTFLLLVFFILFLFFLIHRGTLEYMLIFSPEWSVLSPWIKGFPKILHQIQGFDVIPTLFVISLLFGAVSRIRDFGKRALLIPLMFSCLLPKVFVEDWWWNGIQDQIIYEMSSPDSQTREAAHEWAEILLKRYPNHLQWPKIAEDLAQYYYHEGTYEKSRILYQHIVDRYHDSNQWYWNVGYARTALSSPDFGTPSSETALEIPVVDYENYLTPNWMVLLSLIRYWEGQDIAESEIKIRLKDLSMSDDLIELNSLGNFVELDDAAQNLGYNVLILPANLADVKALISGRIPVIHRRYSSFHLLFGFDESQAVVREYSFDKLSRRLQNEARKEAKEILAIEEEGRGESKKRLARIANEIYNEHSVVFWENTVMRYTGPLIAIVFPAEKTDLVVTTLNIPLDTLKRKSEGYLSTFIGLSYLNHVDPVQAVEWAKIGMAYSNDPLPLYVAHLAKLLWESRDTKIKSTLRLQDQFPELAQIFAYFNEEKNRAFLESAALRFKTDIDTTTFPWFILDTYISMLDRNNPNDFDLIIKLMKKKISINPANQSYWSFLADTYEWTGDIPGMIAALKGEISSNPMDFEAKLRLAYGHVVSEQYADAKSVLETIDVGESKYDADYLFCLGAIAEWEGNVEDALQKYEIAIEMRRYKPMYFLKYGKLLLQEGQKETAKKTLEWAARIDASEQIKQEAEKLLSNM